MERPWWLPWLPPKRLVWPPRPPRGPRLSATAGQCLRLRRRHDPEGQGDGSPQDRATHTHGESPHHQRHPFSSDLVVR